MILFIDNFDSFTYNIVQAFQVIGEEIKVFRNHEMTTSKCLQLNPSQIVIGPGPKSIEDTGASLELIQHFKNKIPILGICLGHQAIGHVFGAKIIRAPVVMHGKTSKIIHNQKGLFSNISQSISMMRYHSLVIDKSSIPSSLAITALSEDDEQIMAIEHLDFPIFGVQFHPESVLSNEGYKLLRNFIKITKSN